MRDAAIALDKVTTQAHDTGPLLIYGPDVDAAGAVLVTALSATGSATSDTQVILSNGATGKVTNSAGAQNITGTFQVADGALTQVVLPATTTMVSATNQFTVPITFTTAREAASTATVAATFTVANGVITAITIA